MPNLSPGPLNAGTPGFEQPYLERPRVSLISASNVIPLNAQERTWFGNGFRYAPEGDVVTGIWPMCDVPDSNATKTPNFQFSSTGQHGQVYNAFVDAYGAVDFFPYAFYASDAVGTLSLAVRDSPGRARRKLNASLPFLLEGELWTGSTNVVGRANPSLQNAARTLTSGPTCVFDAIALLEQAVADGDLRGQQKGGFRYQIHMRPKVLDYIQANASSSNFARRDGNMYLTPMDNILVPGRGYPGTGPSFDTGGNAAGQYGIPGPGLYVPAGASTVTATTEWIYITPVVEIRTDEVFLIGDEPAQGLRRDQNLYTVWAEQIAHAAFDPTINIYAAEICLTTCDC